MGSSATTFGSPSSKPRPRQSRALGVGRPDEEEDAFALVGGADIGRSDTNPFRIEPEAGQVREYGSQCSHSTLVLIVSNNAGAAIETYLAEQGLTSLVAGVFGRVPGDPSSMKPNPRLLAAAMAAAGMGPEGTMFIGDAARDVEAGNAAGVPTIGYANKPGKGAKLSVAGAVAIVESMQTVADALA
ncbi:HAD family hydrolase [Kitasatospora sp. NPDC090308]|uniref:HAD family hydrolase n=1 Tax=Kitasatospora sp. NPDC090308 TaxID=3364082 RepID=UPI0038287768